MHILPVARASSVLHLALALTVGAVGLFATSPAQAQSSDTTLSSLGVEVSTDGVNFSAVGLYPDFSADQLSYDTVVSTSHTHARVTPTANHSSATLRVVSGGGSLTPLASGSTSAAITLVDGANQIRIQVTAEDRDTESYYVTVTRGGRLVPTPPRNVQLIPGNGKLTLTWAPPTYWGSFPAGGHEVDWYAGASLPTDSSDWKRATPTPSPLAATVTSYEFTGTYGDHTVANGTTYQLRIRGFSTNPDDNGDHLPSEWVTKAGTPTAQSLSSNANLSGLTASSSTSASGLYAALTLAPSTFSASTTSYTATVANARTHLKLTPTVADTGKATVAVQGTTVSSGSASDAIELSEGANAITVRVTAQDSTTKDYIVTITRQAPPSSNANLSGLTASSSTSQGGTYDALTLAPSPFSASTTSYTATVGNAKTHAKLTPTVADTGKATVAVQGTTVSSGSASDAIELSEGANAITVRVTAQDSTTKDYIVTITRQAPPSSNANLSGLTASSSTSQGGTYDALTLAPSPFSASTTSYTATVGNAKTHAKLTPTVADTGKATVTVNGTMVNSGSESGPVALSEGSNAITVRVTAQDSTTKDYTVAVTRQTQGAPPEVSLSADPNPVPEGSPATVTATLTATLSAGVTIPLTLTDDSAEPADHGTLAGITIAPNATTGTGTIATHQDDDEDDERFTVALDTANLPSSVTAGSAASVEITITDDDRPTQGDDDDDPGNDDPGDDDNGGGEDDGKSSNCTLMAPYWSGPSGGFAVRPVLGRTSVRVTCGRRTTEYMAEGGLVTRLLRGSCPVGLKLEGAAPGGWYWQHGERNAAAAPLVCSTALGGPPAVVPNGVEAKATADGTWFRHHTARLVGIVPHLAGNECREYVTPYWQGHGGIVARPSEGRESVRVRVQCGSTFSTMTPSAGDDGVVAALVRKDWCTDDEGEPKQGRLTVTGAAPGGWYWIDGERNAAAAPLMCADLLGGSAAVDPGGVTSRATEDGTYFSHDANKLIAVVPHAATDRKGN